MEMKDSVWEKNRIGQEMRKSKILTTIIYSEICNVINTFKNAGNKTI